MAKKAKKLDDSNEMKVKAPRKPGQIKGVGNPGTTTYTGRPGINRGTK